MPFHDPSRVRPRLLAAQLKGMTMKNAKAYAALVGSIATALLAVYAADTPVGKVLTVVSVVATTVATWAVKNTPAE